LVNVELGLGGAVCTAGTARLLLLHAEVDLGFGIVAHVGFSTASVVVARRGGCKLKEPVGVTIFVGTRRRKKVAL
jgi:hypothetical protein